MQKIGAQYVIKKLADEIMTDPAAAATAAAAEAEADAASTAARAGVNNAAREAALAGPDLDGEMIFDEHGEEIGLASRVRTIGVYVISNGYSEPMDVLDRCLGDPDHRMYFQRGPGGRLTGVIFAPHPDRMEQRAAGIRADEI